MELTYTEKNGINYPNIQISNNPEDDQPLGLYGRMALQYLNETRPDLAQDYLITGTLMGKMHQVDREAGEKLDELMDQLLKQNPMPRTDDTLTRAQHMNNIKAQAEEIVLNEIVYQIR